MDGRKGMGVFALIGRYAPFAAVGGYLMVYMNKGYDRILVDIQAITPQKLMAKWQNFAVAGIAIMAVPLVKKTRIPPAIKTIIVVGLYLLAGHQVATAIDPPYNGSTGYVSPGANRYANGGR